jgi:hypothetical protein
MQENDDQLYGEAFPATDCCDEYLHRIMMLQNQCFIVPGIKKCGQEQALNIIPQRPFGTLGAAVCKKRMTNFTALLFPLPNAVTSIRISM